MIRLTIDLDEDVLLQHHTWRVERPRTPRDLERADMLWLSNQKKGLIVDGVRIQKIAVKEMKRTTTKKEGKRGTDDNTRNH